MIAAYAQTTSGHLLAALPVPADDVSRYGILNVTRTCAPLLLADNVVEKPDPDAAPSRTAVIGRYILDPVIFDALGALGPGANGEIQLTDAVAATAGAVGLAGFMFDGIRFDCGSKDGFLAATLYCARRDPAYREVLACSELAAPFANAA